MCSFTLTAASSIFDSQGHLYTFIGLFSCRWIDHIFSLDDSFDEYTFAKRPLIDQAAFDAVPSYFWDSRRHILPGFYQLIMPVPSESNYKKPHIHTPTFLAPVPSLTIYLKVIKLGVLALKHLSQSFWMWENCGTSEPQAIFPPRLSLSVPQKLIKLKVGLQSNSTIKLCTSQHTLTSCLLSLNFFCKSLNSFLKKAFSSSTAIFRFTRSFMSCFSPDSLFEKRKQLLVSWLFLRKIYII